MNGTLDMRSEFDTLLGSHRGLRREHDDRAGRFAELPALIGVGDARALERLHAHREQVNSDPDLAQARELLVTQLLDNAHRQLPAMREALQRLGIQSNRSRWQLAIANPDGSSTLHLTRSPARSAYGEQLKRPRVICAAALPLDTQALARARRGAWQAHPDRRCPGCERALRRAPATTLADVAEDESRPLLDRYSQDAYRAQARNELRQLIFDCLDEPRDTLDGLLAARTGEQLAAWGLPTLHAHARQLWVSAAAQAAFALACELMDTVIQRVLGAERTAYYRSRLCADSGNLFSRVGPVSEDWLALIERVFADPGLSVANCYEAKLAAQL